MRVWTPILNTPRCSNLTSSSALRCMLLKGLEIRSFNQISKSSVSSQSHTLMASNSMVFKLEPSPWDRQAQACIHDKHFELDLFIVGVVCGWSSVHYRAH